MQHLTPEKNPIINSPYEPPQYHWDLDERGVAREPLLPRRRAAAGVMPVPKPIGTKSYQPSFDEAQESDDLKLVNDLRKQVTRWRNQRYPGVTNATKELLDHWNSDQPSPPLFFAQIEAIETLIYVTEVIHQGSDFRKRLDNTNREYNEGLKRLSVKMATGTGKTAVMALVIAWQSINHWGKPKGGKFTNQFAVITPGITVKDRDSKDLRPSKDGQDIYTKWRLIPDNDKYKRAVGNARVSVINFQALRPREIQWGQASGNSKKVARMKPKVETLEETLKRAFPELKEKGRIIVLNDEGHHCHNTEAKPVETIGEDKKAADLWFGGIRMLEKASRLHSIVDFSATPIFIVKSRGKKTDRIFPWTVSDFPLTDAIEAGMVKIPRAPVEDDTIAKEPIYRNLYDNSAGKTRQKSDEITDPLKGALQTLYEEYAASGMNQAWEDGSWETPPVFIVVANDVPNARAIYDHLSGHERDGRWIRGEMDLFSNVDEEGGHVSPPRTILIHSKIDTEGKMPGPLGTYLKRQVAQFKKAYPKHPWPQADADSLREILNTVGKKGNPGENVRCVVSVMMLTEGWDTRTVTHLVGFRKFGTRLLCEQVTGRSLRRVNYDDFDPETKRFPVEYSEVLGVPFNFSFKTKAIPPIPPKPTYEVRPLPNRSDLAIHWPVVSGYTRERKISGEISIDWDKFGHFIMKQTNPTEVKIEGIAGESFTMISHQGRESTAIYLMGRAVAEELEKKALDRKTPQGKAQLFTQSVRTIKDGIAKGRIQVQGDYLGAASDAEQTRGLAREMADACGEREPEKEEENRIRALKNGQHFHGTGEITPYKSSQDTKLDAPEKSQMNRAPCANSWELNVAKTLDGHPLVEAWVRNDRQRWQIPYMHEGEWRKYEPDFMARLRRDDQPRMVVIEVKGQERDEDISKRKFARDYWVPAVNADPDLNAKGEWTYLYVNDPDKAQMQITALVNGTLEDNFD